ncbi:hypothetical protein FALBO_1359 [Fusarium albosuccineum]|uniref:Uncharacterized protein n=1 Tax=Fusarium albosuccineum TaxID=1237068 RepID=A0A8H4LLE3_9HYPO|nr:hypothetical protein FALBO_1359 [Fusarium albosuccineum]
MLSDELSVLLQVIKGCNVLLPDTVTHQKAAACFFWNVMYHSGSIEVEETWPLSATAKQSLLAQTQKTFEDEAQQLLKNARMCILAPGRRPRRLSMASNGVGLSQAIFYVKDMFFSIEAIVQILAHIHCEYYGEWFRWTESLLCGGPRRINGPHRFQDLVALLIMHLDNVDDIEGILDNAHGFIGLNWRG